ncbi:NADPH:quinone oxidoreductase family protein [Sulfuritalea sp.]|uniref:NADPH:quinone oxidoreductase family protein n=1 Tax=Sulfuritalea sp. TaxID=2480090 RepID=UPI001AC38C64|nr:NADPH:quinone oxidoreductase family protein [Sulfuritalea sp.]MBN8477115.1 NADPH:quinone oxidoreductase family protein [Sulfuritalea sp.]
MKALVCEAYGPIANLVVKDIPSPVPGPKQVLIEVKSAAVNFPDALMVQGLYQVKPPLPFTPGAEIAGVVKTFGAEVTQCKPGDRVIALTSTGGFAEECLAEAHRVLPLPAGMDFDSGAALVLTYCTSLHALKDCGHLQPGETLVVLGAAGGVGISAIEIGKAMGARVIAAASSDDKLALCRKVGADETVNYSTENPMHLRDRINELTGGKGADVVYDPVGGPYTEPAVRALAWRGRLLIIGFAAGEIPKIPLNLALLKERSLVGVYWGDSTKHDPAGHLANLRQLNDWFAAGKIRPVVSERYTLDAARDALAAIANRQVKGKIVVVPDA